MKSHICLRSSQYANFVCVLFLQILWPYCANIVYHHRFFGCKTEYSNTRLFLTTCKSLTIWPLTICWQRVRLLHFGFVGCVDNPLLYFYKVCVWEQWDITLRVFPETKSEKMIMTYCDNTSIVRPFNTRMHEITHEFLRSFNSFCARVGKTETNLRWAHFTRELTRCPSPLDGVTMRTSYHAQVLSATSRAHVRRQRALTSRCVDSANSICDEKFRRVVAARIFFAKYLCTLCDIIQYLGLCTTF